MISKLEFTRIANAIRTWNRASYHMEQAMNEYGVQIENELTGIFLDEMIEVFEDMFNDKSYSGTGEDYGRDSIISQWLLSFDRGDDNEFKDSEEVYDYLINRSLANAHNGAAPEGE